MLDLIKEWSWGHDYNYELQQGFAWSPCHRFRIGYYQIDPGASWRIAAAREPLAVPEWMAGFSRDTPAELIAATVQTLRHETREVDWTGDAHPAFQPPHGRDDITNALRQAGWSHHQDADGVKHFESSDGLARATLRPNAGPLDLMGRCNLAIEAGPADAGIPWWQALFTTGTPSVVTDAFTQALTDPAPLTRDPDWMDEELLQHVNARPDSAVHQDTARRSAAVTRTTGHSPTGGLDPRPPAAGQSTGSARRRP
ncbi:DUF317 domain-containing protein [Kitasatospora sp. NPDC004669]|uniref:DUF317 domain-containing protein n=1 Tax=Kitasatospora sp. NPDC004669 TaxID=3154555 RepID=UPI0033B0C06D